MLPNLSNCFIETISNYVEQKMSESVSELTVPTLDATSSLPTSTTLGEAKQVEIESSLSKKSMFSFQYRSYWTSDD